LAQIFQERPYQKHVFNLKYRQLYAKHPRSLSLLIPMRSIRGIKEGKNERKEGRRTAVLQLLCQAETSLSVKLTHHLHLMVRSRMRVTYLNSLIRVIISSTIKNIGNKIWIHKYYFTVVHKGITIVLLRNSDNGALTQGTCIYMNRNYMVIMNDEIGGSVRGLFSYSTATPASREWGWSRIIFRTADNRARNLGPDI
jgi:hypothetical protein